MVDGVFGDDSSNKGGYYLFYYVIVWKDRERIKVCVVYDGFGKILKNEFLFNDCLEVGLNYILYIFYLLIKFCCNVIGLLVNIEKVFLNVGIKE